MAIVIEANYSKKLGLPEFSSHQYSVTVRTEVSDLAKLEEESQRLYRLLQRCVDGSLQESGYVPGNRNGNGNGKRRTDQGHEEDWNCSPGQRELITNMVQEHNLDKLEVENNARRLFGKGVKELNKLEASGLIKELMRNCNRERGSARFKQGGSK